MAHDIITLKSAFERWANDIQPAVIAQYGSDDRPALSESWNDFTDSLCKNGELTGIQYHYCPAYDEPMPDCDREFILDEMGVSFGTIRVAERPDGDLWHDGVSHWRVLFKRGNHDLTAFYSMGSACTGQPQMADVFNCLLNDSDNIEGNDFEGWASDYGFDTDSRKAERVFNACQKTLLELKRLFTASELEELRELFHDY